jgi:flagellar protein FlbD
LITLHRFNSGKEFVLNADQIKMIEETPDTLITLMNSEKILVDDSLSDVLTKTITFARTIRTPAEYLSDPITESRKS